MAPFTFLVVAKGHSSPGEWCLAASATTREGADDVAALLTAQGYLSRVVVLN